jgi:hypothetical protein
MSNEIVTTEESAPAIPAAKMLDAPLGIYFSMGESEYHQDCALGSSSLKTLSYSPQSWWWHSLYNPLRPAEEDTPAKIYGRAVHKIILEGRAEFDRLYGPKELNWATKEGKLEKQSFIDAKKTALPRELYDRAAITGGIVRANPATAEALEGGVGSEVSVFWRNKRGIKKKARFDRLKLKAIIDIKNVANERQISFPNACLRKIDEFSWHIQAEAYREARLAMPKLLREGAVFGEHDAKLLERTVASPEWAWIWIFVQSSGAPLTWSRMLTFKKQIVDKDGVVTTDGVISPIYQIARARIAKAEENYLSYMEEFGPNTPWITAEPIKELHYEDLPSWFNREEPT